MNKEQHITRNHKTLGVKCLFEIQFSQQSPVLIDSKVAPKTPPDSLPSNFRGKYFKAKFNGI